MNDGSVNGDSHGTQEQALREFCGPKRYAHVVQSVRSTGYVDSRRENYTGDPDAGFPTQYPITRRASQPAEPCTALMGKDDLRAMRMDYSWWGRQR